ncbi:diguanylate cyclase/phosphodiesterase [Salinisphaera sp. T5B8]|uniref:putative bifunctional diguanylate cyclase/phosphodiesterase n=1 Tax=Salinisphaera sp. T5B8 TaxID=1304154 RepID=UPI00333E2897
MSMLDSLSELETIATGVAVIDAECRFVSANTAFAHRLNIDTLPDRLTDIALADTRSNTLLGRQLRDHGESALTVEITPGRPLTLYFGACRAQRRLVIAATGWPQRDETTRELAAQLDPLTGFGNRLMYAERIRALKAANATASAVLVIDLDRFKQVNDTLGHGAGDELLTLVAQRIRASTRGTDTLIRLGGDEFAILVPDEPRAEGLNALAQRLVGLLGRPFLVNGQQINIGASIGIATTTGDSERLDDLLHHADLALYDAKRRGRGCHRVFRAQLEQRALERRAFESDLRQALARGQFVLHYQPQTAISEQRVSAFEALIRWQHPTRGLVRPREFISLAEEIGEIVPIGNWVIRCACDQAMTWPDTRLRVAVNVSPVQFANDDIIDAITQALENSGLAPERLEIEITEGLLLDESPAIMQRLWAIKQLGVAIVMDDFGTGYASLSYLNNFPFSKIKIDKTFIQDGHSPRAKALVSGIIAMGTNLNIATIAEGVETAAQYAQIEHDGCDIAQGYYIAKPMPADEIADFLARFHNRRDAPSLTHQRLSGP